MTSPVKEKLAKVTERQEKFALAASEAKISNMRLHESLTENLKALHTLTLSPDDIEAGLPNANDLITGWSFFLIIFSQKLSNDCEDLYSLLTRLWRCHFK